MPHSIVLKLSTFLFSIPAARTGPGILEVLDKFFIEWVSELFPLVMLLFCLHHPHCICHSSCCYLLSCHSQTQVQAVAIATLFYFLLDSLQPSCFGLPYTTRILLLKHQRDFSKPFIHEHQGFFPFGSCCHLHLPFSPAKHRQILRFKQGNRADNSYHVQLSTLPFASICSPPHLN